MTSMTDNELKADRAALTNAVARFARAEIAPYVTAWDAAGEFPRSLYRRAGELGLLGLGYPEAYGGTPAPDALRMALWVALSHYGASGGVLAGLLSHNIGLPPLLAHGSEELRREVIPAVRTTGEGSKGSPGSAPQAGGHANAHPLQDCLGGGTVSERLYREVKIMMIGGGAEDIMKDLAARQWRL